MTTTSQLRTLNDAECIELARMLLARKLMPEDTIGILSPMVNSPLAQGCALHMPIPAALAAWLPLLRDQFFREISDTSSDPNLGQHLRKLEDDDARRDILRQYFLPFQASPNFALTPPTEIADAFGAGASGHPPNLNFNPLYPALPKDGKVGLPQPFVTSIFDQMLIGRHSHVHLEARRDGKTNRGASDAVIHAFLDLLGEVGPAETLQPFHRRELHEADFAQSFAYTQMMELGFSREEMMDVLSPWTLIEGSTR